MPFTPFHFGPGLLLKALAPARFSFTAFVLTQVLIDFETGYYLLSGQFPLHRFFHSMAGSILVGLGGAILLWIGLGSVRTRPEGWGFLFQEETRIPSMLVGGVLGGVSHSLLDNIMHSDVRLLYGLDGEIAPPANGTALHGIIGLGSLHMGCVLSFLLGAGILLARWNHARAD